MEEKALLPLFLKLDSMLQEKEVLLAIDGGSAAGKTTLGKLLEQRYACNVFHMDDFFLRPEQRTKERLAEPGGNVDRERFYEEVLQKLVERKEVTYRRYDCKTMSLLEPVTLAPTRLTVVEGAYSMHPLFSKHYDYSVFLEVDKETQIERIRKRNTPKMAKRFFQEWILLEQEYFEKLRVKERCDMVI
ncbi:MAG: hypothetical protein E7299_04355 [Lachnospiraceae bacterium]|nr:hypothetical protein [Lachnospiraceae bacterium]